ncbi:bifunctional proline dehydrogenase/L-glutamate gamma-semialdehyde dehydrogenase PutA [Candidatus Carsonella ruddii]|uniref:Bifunctional protein PutA n=1 Tax=Candidatus Carsonella ruddii CE isolate Thao2000 TaxID=1202536 RepID=J7GVZ2_CARRU|nr:bifunctional proline dehydrogenase/L-glutamate gamma-semialdehyde dehydrogenase PutA [Candidatus Carsonella ruddii]AFP83561.1 delta-1-pyrroline-5-carboxylate dehydrogenase [Candidatus Carsonella ruddii CE isolate Thao2000]
MKKNYLLNIVSKHYSIEENIYLYNLLKFCNLKNIFFKKVDSITGNITNERRKNLRIDIVDNILNEYNLSTKEGIQMMCLAESLLRIPDFITADSFIKDKISFQNWKEYYLTDYWKILFYNMVIEIISNFYYKKSHKVDKKFFINYFKSLIYYFSNNVMKIIGEKFVYANNIKTAIYKSLSDKRIYSFDMLGEAAITFYDARKFYNQYKKSLYTIKNFFSINNYNNRKPTMSIKLSALHPKYSFFNRIRVLRDLPFLIKNLLMLSIKFNISITIDAEECDRMELSLIIYKNIFYSNFCEEWNKFGLVVQAYSKRALPTLYWLNKISKELKKKIPVRLVKGAYWDYEIKLCQYNNMEYYPVYTNKFCTDLSYLLCTIYLLYKEVNDTIIPQFATHNIQTIATVIALSENKNYEFQKLFGMGNFVYYFFKKQYNINYREYAPIGEYKELLPYLVRRLLENGANSSFINKIIYKNTNYYKLINNPLSNLILRKYNNKIPLPLDLYGGKRKFLQFYNLNISNQYYIFMKKMFFFEKKYWVSTSFNNLSKKKNIIFQPSNKYSLVGINNHDYTINYSIRILKKSFLLWNKISLIKKIKILKNFIFLINKNFIELIILCAREAGKTILDCISDIKEGVDFCKYYCNQIFFLNKNIVLPNITGESNIFVIESKGIFATISPWNFPIAIFLGQLIAALISGNVVISKPAETTSLIAYRLFQFLYKAGLPIGVCQIVIGSGTIIGNMLSFNNNVYGIIFTGSNNVADKINKNLAMRDNNPLHKIIAETGGLNVMIVDSTALIDQVILDVVDSAFKSSGQRCSALRLIYINENIYYDTIKLLLSVLENLKIGDPLDLTYDIGPVITKKSLINLKKYRNNFEEGKIYYNKIHLNIGNYIEPTLLRINGINDMTSEQFGPILHISIYKNNQISNIIDDINLSNFGLTCGIHSRNENFYKFVSNKIKVGNVYINRNTIGAIVGMQPFGGCNLSGTGPKAGGFNYLLPLLNEKTITVNTTAQGGNIELLNE